MTGQQTSLQNARGDYFRIIFLFPTTVARQRKKNHDSLLKMSTSMSLEAISKFLCLKYTQKTFFAI